MRTYFQSHIKTLHFYFSLYHMHFVIDVTIYIYLYWVPINIFKVIIIFNTFVF